MSTNITVHENSPSLLNERCLSENRYKPFTDKKMNNTWMRRGSNQQNEWYLNIWKSHFILILYRLKKNTYLKRGFSSVGIGVVVRFGLWVAGFVNHSLTVAAVVTTVVLVVDIVVVVVVVGASVPLKMKYGGACKCLKKY